MKPRFFRPRSLGVQCLTQIPPIAKPATPAAPGDNMPRPTEMPVIQIQPTHCCGFRYLHGIQAAVQRPSWSKVSAMERLRDPAAHWCWLNSEEIIRKVQAYFASDNRCGTLAFTQASKRLCVGTENAGDELMKYIIDNDLGQITRGEPTENPNTRNAIVTFLWNVNPITMFPIDDDGDHDEDF